MTPIGKRLAFTTLLSALLALTGLTTDLKPAEAKSSIRIGVSLGDHHDHRHHVRKHRSHRHYKQHPHKHRNYHHRKAFKPYFCSHHYMRHDYNSHYHYHGYGHPTNRYHPSNEGRYHKRRRRHVSVWRY